MFHVPTIKTDDPDRQIEFSHTINPSAGPETWRRDNEICLGHFKINVFIRGDFSVIAGGEAYKPDYLSVMALPPATIHYGQIQSPTELDYYQLDIGIHAFDILPDGEKILARLYDNISLRGFLFHTGLMGNGILSLCKKIEASIEKSEMTAAYLYTAELLCEINSAYRGGTPLSGTLSKTVRDAIAYIEKNYTEAIQLSDVSSSLGVSESYLSRKFKSEVGTTVHEYLTRERILYASRLLSSGHSVSYTSYECGFADSSHFISVFKKITGFTPSEYKKRIK